jgi:hypothetical protein
MLSRLKKHMPAALAIGFVVLSALLLWLLSNPPAALQREGIDDTLVRLDKIETHDKEQDEEIDQLKKQFSDSTSRISDGEKQANAAIGNMQMVI